MAERLQNRIAIVTGSNSGIGRAIVVAYAREGAIVICASRREESGFPAEQDISTHDLIAKNGGTAEFMQTFIGDWKSTDALFEKVKEEYGRIDILVNCAADRTSPPSTLGETELTQPSSRIVEGTTILGDVAGGLRTDQIKALSLGFGVPR